MRRTMALTLIRAGILVGVASVGLAACSGSGNSSSSTTGQSATATSAPVTTTTAVPTTTTTSLPADVYKAACQTMPYANFVKDPASMAGQCITYQAQVFQYDSRTGLTTMLVDVTNNDGYWADTVQVDLPSASLGANVVQNDIVQFWGPIVGASTYDTATGGSNTVPEVQAQYLTLISSGN